MICPDTEKVVLFYYNDLPFSQREEMNRHISNCPQCSELIGTILKLDSIRATPAPSLQKVTLEKAISAGNSFSLKEKVLAMGLCFAFALAFMVTRSSLSPSFYQDSDFTFIESEISAIKYDMADFSDSAIDYAISCIDISGNIKEEEI